MSRFCALSSIHIYENVILVLIVLFLLTTNSKGFQIVCWRYKNSCKYNKMEERLKDGKRNKSNQMSK